MFELLFLFLMFIVVPFKIGSWIVGRSVIGGAARVLDSVLDEQEAKRNLKVERTPTPSSSLIDLIEDFTARIESIKEKRDRDAHDRRDARRLS